MELSVLVRKRSGMQSPSRSKKAAEWGEESKELPEGGRQSGSGERKLSKKGVEDWVVSE